MMRRPPVRVLFFMCVGISLGMIITALYAIKHPSTLAFPLPGSGVIYTIQNDIQSIRSDDHYRGNPDASVILIEYSDYTCYFCHTMREVFMTLQKTYPTIGFVYRHRPRDGGNPFLYAKAAECVAFLKGEEAFWRFTDRVYATPSPSPERIERAVLKEGISTPEYNRCLKYPTIEKRVNRDWNEAKRVGVPGTPFIIVVHNHQVAGVLYALPFGAFEQALMNFVGKGALQGTDGRNMGYTKSDTDNKRSEKNRKI